jgi:hypothetical protein
VVDVAPDRPLLHHRRPTVALAGRPLVLELVLTPSRDGYQVRSAWRQGVGGWSDARVQVMSRRRFRVTLVPEQGPLQYRFDVVDRVGTSIAGASYRLEVGPPRVRVLPLEPARTFPGETSEARLERRVGPRLKAHVPRGAGRARSAAPLTPPLSF